MTNLFDKKNSLAIKNHLECLDYEFTKDEKEAILSCLFVIANSDNDYHQNEKAFLEEIAKFIGYKMDDFIKENYKMIEKESTYAILNGFGEDQKDWFVITTFLMIYADGIAKKDEYIQLENYFEKIGITKKKWQEVIAKTQDILGL